MKGYIVVVDCAEQFVDRNIYGQLFAYLSAQSLLWCFASLNFSARKLPPIFIFAITTLCGQIFAIVNNDGSYNIYRFHTL